MPTITGLSVAIGSALIPGGAIGEHAVPGDLEPGDTLLAVTHITDGAPPVPTNLTAEFAITAGKGATIENDTTDTTGDFLFDVWAKPQ